MSEILVTDFPLVTVIGDGFELRSATEEQKATLGCLSTEPVWTVYDSLTQRHVSFNCAYEDRFVRIAVDNLLAARRTRGDFATMH